MQKSPQRKRHGHMFSEFAFVVFILLLLIAFPLINLIALVMGVGVSYLVVRQTASVAATQPTYNAALTEMKRQANWQLNSNLAKFAHIMPVAGYEKCGVDLYVLASKYSPTSTKEYGPNTPVPPPIDTTGTIYECSARGAFDIQPFINMEHIPWIGNVPGLGKPARIVFSADRAVEYPAGLVGAGSLAMDNSMPVAFNAVPSSNSANGGTNDSGWTTPNIYQMIADSGKSVVNEAVCVVPANLLNFTWTGVTVNEGQQIWLDTQASGNWILNWENTGPDGSTARSCPNGLPNGVLLGQLGQNTGNPIFVLGADKFNMVPKGSGVLWLAPNSASFIMGWGTTYCFNDQFTNAGWMTVRVVVTE